MACVNRIINQGSAQYERSVTSSTTNGYWTGTYSGILADIAFLEPFGLKLQILQDT